ncbi:uncharacterized protein Dwil_GK17184 [Drosophila willistoni]|uniref:Vitelline membrane protein Vm26Ab n=1 Tax=Drosophila willistoni TaxID=7260 RepID=B4MKR5_DROWI|nr:uncharacterized protein Dwil_GK17184 [Drosophila willistoni]
MYKFAVCFFAVVAVAAAKPGLLAAAPLAYTAPAVVGSAAYVAPYASSYTAHHVAHSAAFPAAYTAPFAAAAYTAPLAAAAYTAPYAAAYTAPIARFGAPAYTAAYTSPLAYSSPYVARPFVAAAPAAPLLLKK